MKPNNLGEYLKEKTQRKLIGKGDGLIDYRTDIQINDVPQKDVDDIKTAIADFYKQNGYEQSKIGDDIFIKDKHSKGIAFSYFEKDEEVLISVITVGMGGIND